MNCNVSAAKLLSWKHDRRSGNRNLAFSSSALAAAHAMPFRQQSCPEAGLCEANCTRQGPEHWWRAVGGAGYIGEFEFVDDHRGGKLVVELNGRCIWAFLRESPLLEKRRSGTLSVDRLVCHSMLSDTSACMSGSLPLSACNIIARYDVVCVSNCAASGTDVGSLQLRLGDKAACIAAG